MNTITLWISNYGGWSWTKETGQMTKVIFTGPDADAHAVAWYERRVGIRRDDEGNVTSWGLVCELDEETDVETCPLLWARMNPECEHGLSANLCAGPGHYPMDM